MKQLVRGKPLMYGADSSSSSSGGVGGLVPTTPLPPTSNNRRAKGGSGGNGRKKDSHQAPPLSHDNARRLVLAETIAQKTVNRTITGELKATEKRVSLYLDAGLLGIAPNDMARHMVEGYTEAEIVEHYYKKSKGDKTSSLDGKRMTPEEADDDGDNYSNKRPRVSPESLAGVATLTEKSIQDALIAIGAN